MAVPIIPIAAGVRMTIAKGFEGLNGTAERSEEKPQKETKPEGSAPKVYALIIDPDTSLSTHSRHLLNTERNYKRVQSYNPDGVYILAPKASEKFKRENVIFSEDPSQDNLGRALAAIKEIIRPNDHLLIFVTGHGQFNKKNKEACLVFPGGELDPADPRNVTETEFGNMLAQLPKVNRTIFMDQCFGGEWLDTLSSPSTFFAANSGKEEATFCEPWVRRLNSLEVPDLRKDGIISNVERVAYASGVDQPYGITTSMGPEYIDYGYGNIPAVPLYDSEVKHIRTKDQFETWRKMNPYGVIVLKFGAEWCQPCNKLSPHIDEMAKQHKGRVLFLNVDLTKDYDRNELFKEFGQKSLPSVFIIKGNTIAEMSTEDTANPTRIKIQIDQMLMGTHPALSVSAQNSRPIAEDTAKPTALRVRALKIEADQGGTALDWLSEFLKDPDWSMRRAALQILWKKTPDDQIKTKLYEKMLPLLEDDSIEVRILAAHYITELEEYPKVIKKFIGQAMLHSDPLVRMDAAVVIRNTSDPSSFPLILKLAEDSDPLVQHAALFQIYMWNLKEAIPALQNIAASPMVSPENKKYAEYILEKGIKGEGRPLSKKKLSDLRAEFKNAKGYIDRIPLAAQIRQIEQQTAK